MPGEHAVVPPSGMKRFLACQYSVFPRGDEGLPTNEAAEEGTRVHALVPDALLNGIEPPKDDAAYEQVLLIMDYVDSLGPGILRTEERTYLMENVWGTVDISHLQPPVLTIVDYKNGKWDVPVFELAAGVKRGNEQLMSYAAGELERLRWPPEIKWVRLCIIQPNGIFGRPVKDEIFPVSAVREHLERVRVAVANMPFAKPNPGPHCRYCPRFGPCEATQAVLPTLAHSLALPPSQIPDDALVRVARTMRGIVDFHKMIDKELTLRMLSGKSFGDDAVLKSERKFRAWKDDGTATRILYEKYGPKGVKPVSPAAAEKLGADGKELAKTLAHSPPGDLKASY